MTGDRAREIYIGQIRDLALAERLHLLALLSSDLAARAEWILEEEPRDIMELYGIGEGRGVGMDAQEYVRRLREGRSIYPDAD